MYTGIIIGTVLAVLVVLSAVFTIIVASKSSQRRGPQSSCYNNDSVSIVEALRRAIAVHARWHNQGAHLRWSLRHRNTLNSHPPVATIHRSLHLSHPLQKEFMGILLVIRGILLQNLRRQLAPMAAVLTVPLAAPGMPVGPAKKKAIRISPSFGTIKRRQANPLRSCHQR